VLSSCWKQLRAHQHHSQDDEKNSRDSLRTRIDCELIILRTGPHALPDRRRRTLYSRRSLPPRQSVPSPPIRHPQCSASPPPRPSHHRHSSHFMLQSKFVLELSVRSTGMASNREGFVSGERVVQLRIRAYPENEGRGTCCGR
jgi:hypothetical protein